MVTPAQIKVAHDELFDPLIFEKGAGLQRLEAALLKIIADNGGGGGGSGGGLPANAAQESGGNLDAILAEIATKLEEGAPITGEVIPSGSGALGWLSGIRQAINSILAIFNPAPTRAGSTNVSDLPVVGKIRRISAQNRTATVAFLQFHTNASSLSTGNVPTSGQIFTVPVNGQIVLGAADFGLNGAIYPANTRIGYSSTFGTYTSAASANQALFLETI